MHRLNGRYAQLFNDLYELDGHLFQGRFGSTAIENEGHLLSTIRYIALNPVEAGFCSAAEEWPWSSYRSSIGRAEAPAFLSTEMVLQLFGVDRRRAQLHLASFVAGMLM